MVWDKSQSQFNIKKFVVVVSIVVNVYLDIRSWVQIGYLV